MLPWGPALNLFPAHLGGVLGGGQGSLSLRQRNFWRSRKCLSGYKRAGGQGSNEVDLNFSHSLSLTILSGLGPPEMTKVQLFGDITLTAAIWGFKNQEAAKKIYLTPQIRAVLAPISHTSPWSPLPSPSLSSDHTEKITGAVLLPSTRQGPVETQHRGR